MMSSSHTKEVSADTNVESADTKAVSADSKQVSADTSASTNSAAEGAGLDVGNPSEESSKVKRTHTIIVDATSSTGTDVGVQATPAAVFADSNAAQKPQKGILHVTSDMRKSVISLSTQNHSDNHARATNTKEKTPMCLVNELARYNKVAHSYMLVDEKGPAHKKEFKIRLALGPESYYATGSSIKRAQHAAAEVAINTTKMSRPSVKSSSADVSHVPLEKKKVAVVTPTVELNALAMKLGEDAEYINIESPVPHIHPNYLYPVSDYYCRYRVSQPMYHPPFLAPQFRHRMPMPCTVILRIGRHEFRGQGVNKQLARHNAASRALRVLKNTQFQHQQRSSTPQHNKNTAEKVAASDAASPVSSPVPSEGDVATGEDTHTTDSANPDSAVSVATKSEISQVHEIALRLGKAVTFDVIHESGPPHMRNFITRCICGDFTSDGEGNSKRLSKKAAAERMLAQLQEVEQPAVVSRPRVKNIANKKKNRNLIKMQKANVEYGSGINPISRLIQVQQAKKRKEPLYTLVMEHGLPRRREFIMQVECNDKACQGKGPNKKLAKRNAAEEMLHMMGYSEQSPVPGKSVLKSPDHTGNSHHKHVTFEDSSQSPKLPGVIVRKGVHGDMLNQEMPPFKTELAASMAKELLEQGKSVVGETLLPAKEHPKYPLKRAREQLEYLGSCMGFAIQFTDFPKVVEIREEPMHSDPNFIDPSMLVLNDPRNKPEGTNTNMCLTVVSLQTNPSQVFHGSAPTFEDSHDKVALQALTKLALQASTKLAQSVRDDDSVEEITPPIVCNKAESAGVIDSDEQKASGDANTSATNGQIPNELHESKSVKHENDMITKQCAVSVEEELQSSP